ncbi:hypothetical protein [Virgibacillus sp. L01]|uniref:hypothetical protein n=1 Tax=Virgibacillus sp. L01 TaxID=3457429 RepID=UPI003FD38D34
MSEYRIVSPVCPKCESKCTYDFSQEYKHLDPAPLQPVTIGNAKYHCKDCGYEWKKYRGRKIYELIQVIDIQSGGYMDYGSVQRMRIDLKHRRVRKALLIGEFNEFDQIATMSEECIDWLLAELYKCDFVNWAEEYNHDGVLDGSYWRLTIEYDTHCEIKIGSNHYPKKWAKFCKVVSKVSGEDFY